MKTDPFREYLIQAEPGRREKGYAWNTAIGLQSVDGLKPSQYLVDTAVQNIEGKITIEEANIEMKKVNIKREKAIQMKFMVSWKKQ